MKTILESHAAVSADLFAAICEAEESEFSYTAERAYQELYGDEDEDDSDDYEDEDEE